MTNLVVAIVCIMYAVHQPGDIPFTKKLIIKSESEVFTSFFWYDNHVNKWFQQRFPNRYPRIFNLKTNLRFVSYTIPDSIKGALPPSACVCVGGGGGYFGLLNWKKVLFAMQNSSLLQGKMWHFRHWRQNIVVGLLLWWKCFLLSLCIDRISHVDSFLNLNSFTLSEKSSM